MIDPVQLFFRPCEFMFFDHVIEIVIYRRQAYQACLSSSFPGKFINIVTGLFILEEDMPFCKLLKVGLCFLIYFITIGVGAVRKVDLWFSNMEKRNKIAGGFFFCFCGIQY